ncbi:outer membrane protein assembly factor BamD [Vibrio chagasii]|nr:outer membrane protein assembly factor BamD [Vibrio chagasii]
MHKNAYFALKNRLADYDLATADFYLRHEAWIAAINRTQELQKTYPDTIAARKSHKNSARGLQTAWP